MFTVRSLLSVTITVLNVRVVLGDVSGISSEVYAIVIDGIIDVCANDGFVADGFLFEKEQLPDLVIVDPAVVLVCVVVVCVVGSNIIVLFRLGITVVTVGVVRVPVFVWVCVLVSSTLWFICSVAAGVVVDNFVGEITDASAFCLVNGSFGKDELLVASLLGKPVVGTIVAVSLALLSSADVFRAFREFVNVTDVVSLVVLTVVDIGAR